MDKDCENFKKKELCSGMEVASGGHMPLVGPILYKK
jgi:hypothetical protein